jgi:hypothetical protein
MTSSSHFQLILGALDGYAKETGIDLTNNPFSTSLQGCNSPDDILQLIRDKAKAFKEFREGNRKLINWLKPVVSVVHAFAGTLGQGITTVSRVQLSVTRVHDLTHPTAWVSPSTDQRLRQMRFLRELTFSSWYVYRLHSATKLRHSLLY